MLSGFWIFVLIFSTMYTVQSGRHLVTAQSSEGPKVYQHDAKLSVNIGASTTLQCCVFGKGIENGEVIWFKQQNEKQPQVIIRFFNTAREMFYKEFQNSRFQIKRFGHCFNLTILNTTLCDEATYYCALVSTDGTRLQMKGERFNAETSKAALCDNSVVCEPTPHGNNTNTDTQHDTAIGLGSTLGLCAVLIFCLACFILRRRKHDKRDPSGRMQESDTETLTYAAVHFTKRKDKTKKRKAELPEVCMYSSV
ncbi:uncharacterized protein LOC132855935 isoform X2 [Tachysurus vachellii]|uniref:uncharacterized protein LOC132855935 isoform X2 n=1 Tax=Tachysurus vachellii TaxID=175792 RepID=UPI00296B4FA3|nr:uncharacterized protein LOC132855935 isoform X2 [Tachysurus vachellii]